MGFCADLSCDRKRQEKIDKYQPLLQALESFGWGRVDLVCIPVGHAGTLLNRTAEELATALSTVRPGMSKKRKRTQQQQEDDKEPKKDKNAFYHDLKIAKGLLDKVSDLASSRLLQILAFRTHELRKLGPTSPPPCAPSSRRGHPPYEPPVS